MEQFSSTGVEVLLGKNNRRREELRVQVIEWQWWLLSVRKKIKAKVMGSKK